MGYPTDEQMEEARSNRAPPRRAMTLNEYQHAALRTATVDPVAKLDSLGLARDGLGIGGEAGEVQDIIKKHIGHGHTLDAGKVGKELGDVLWYVAVLAERIGWTLEDVAKANVEKLRARYPEGFDPERSKNRAAE
jgi:NTP pyrophosphatase (non-canonical NTP hydrolase)